MSLISILKLSLAEILIDKQNNTFIIKFTDNNYNREEFTQLLEYFKNFWLLAKEQNNKYHMLFDIKELGIYPLQQLDILKNILISLEDYFKSSLHSTVLLTENIIVLNIIKPLLNSYKAVRPFEILKTLDEAYTFYANNKLV